MRPLVPLAATMAGVGALGGLLALAIAGGAWVVAIGLLGVLAGGVLVLRWPRAAFLGVLLTGPTIAGLVSGIDAGGIPVLTPDRAILAALVVATAFRVARRPERWLPSGSIDRPMLAFLGICLVSLLVSGGSLAVRGGMRQDLVFLAQGYGIPAVCFLLARNLLGDAAGVRALSAALLVVGSLVALSGLAQTLGGVEWFASGRYAASHGERAGGTLPSSGEFGLVVNLAATIAIHGLLRGATGARRVVLGVLVVVMILALVLAKTRAIWLGFAFSLALLAWFEPPLRRPLLLLSVVLGVVGALALPLVVDLEAMQKRMAEPEPIYNRVALSTTALNMIAHHPLTGIGFARFGFVDQKVDYLASAFGVPEYWAQPGVPHCEPLHILVLVGLIGFIPFALVIMRSWRLCATAVRWPASPERDFGVVAAIALAVFMLVGMTLETGFYQFASVQLAVVLGALDGLRCARERGAT